MASISPTPSRYADSKRGERNVDGKTRREENSNSLRDYYSSPSPESGMHGILHGRDIRELVFSFLDARSIGNAARVSKAWYSSSSSQRLWHGLYTRAHGPALPRGSQIVDWRAKFLEVDSAWESLIRSRRSILTFFGPESLALLLAAIVVVIATAGLVTHQHVAMYTYEPQPAYLRAWRIDKSIEEDSESDELVVTYRLHLSIIRPTAFSGKGQALPPYPPPTKQNRQHDGVHKDQAASSQHDGVHKDQAASSPFVAAPSNPSDTDTAQAQTEGAGRVGAAAPARSFDNECKLGGEDEHSCDLPPDGRTHGDKYDDVDGVGDYIASGEYRSISPRLYPLTKEASGTLEEQISLLGRIHPPSSKMAEGVCAQTTSPVDGETPHSWRRWCGGLPTHTEDTEQGALVNLYQPGRLGGGGGVIARSCLGVLTALRSAFAFLRFGRYVRDDDYDDHVYSSSSPDAAGGARNDRRGSMWMWPGLCSKLWSLVGGEGGLFTVGDDEGFLLREYVVFPYFWLSVSASTALLTVACACRSDHAGTKPASSSIPRMEFEPVARRWAFRLLDSREVSQDRTRMVLATALFMFHMFTSVPLAHLAFLVPKSRVEGGDDSASTGAFVILLFVAVQVVATAPTIAAWRAWKQAARIRAMRFYSEYAPHLKKGGNSCVLARVEARIPLTINRVDFRLQCHETYLHLIRVRGGETETSKRTRVLWTRTYNVCDTPEDIVPSQPEVFSKIIDLPESIRESSVGPLPYYTWFLSCIITATPLGEAAGEQIITHEVSVNIVDERARAGQQMPLRLGEDGSDSGAGGDSKESTLVDEETHPDEGKDGTDDDEDDETGRDAKSSAESTSISATCCSYFNDN